VFETVNPLTYIQLRPWDPEENEELSHDAYWKAVSFIPTKQLPSMAIFFKPTTIIAYLAGLAVLLSAVLALVISSHKRKLLRQQIAGQALRFRRIANALGEGLLVINHAGVITYANPEAGRILGWDANELIMCKYLEVFSREPGEQERCPILGVLDSGDVFRSQLQVFRHKDGHSIPVDLNAAPLGGNTGEEGVVVSFRDYSTIKRYQEEIHQLAFHDTLTGLPNRRVLEDRLTQALSFAGRYNHFIALLFLDLDHFKQVNDVHGHAAGDALLKEVADRLHNCVRDTDTVVRMGGDEFIILLPELQHVEDAQMIAEKILTALSYPLLVNNQDMGISASIGIAVTKGHPVTTDQLLQKADSAMYQAKHAGRNNYVTVTHFSESTGPGVL
jgi:diguanylate cyclase (GGDEF)-like protein/PAS domain S-box-containing protein